MSKFKCTILALALLIYPACSDDSIEDLEARTGTVEVSGTFNMCPVIGIYIAPTDVKVGGHADMQVSASDADGDLLTYSWTANSVQFGTGKTARFWCTKAGKYTIRIAVSDGHCKDMETFSVMCR